MSRGVSISLVPVIAVLAGIVLASGEGVARGDDREEQAVEFFRAGSAAYQRGDYRAAARSFDAANKAVPRAVALYNEALAWEAATERPRAADAFAAALAMGGLGAAESARSTGALASLEKSLALVHVAGPAGSRASVEHVSDVTPPVDVHLEPGWHDVVGVVDGVTLTRHVQVAAAQRLDVSLAPEAEVPPPSQPAADASPRESSARGAPVRRVAGISLLGAGVATSVAAIVLGIDALAARDAFDESQDLNRGDHDRAYNLRLATNVCWGAAAALGAAGGVLLLTTLGRGSQSSVVVGLGAISWSSTF
jgi:hypothetical protein